MRKSSEQKNIQTQTSIQDPEPMFSSARWRLRWGYPLIAVTALLLLLGAAAGGYVLFILVDASTFYIVAGAGVLLVVLVIWTLISSLRFVRDVLLTAENIVTVLRESKQRYMLAIEGSRQGLWDWDLVNDTIYFSPQWKRMLGFSEEDVIDTSEFWRNRIHPEDRVAFEKALEQHLSGLTPDFSVEYRIKNKFGTYRWIRDRGRAVHDDDNNAIRLAGSARDITSMKDVEDVLNSRTEELVHAKARVEEEMRNSKKFQQAVEAATDAISIMNSDGLIMYVNPAWEQLTGYPSHEGEESQFVDLYKKETPHVVLENMWSALRAGKSFISEEAVGTRRDGSEFQASISVFPVTENGRAVFYTAIQQDITKRKEVDEAKTEFVSLASHQLRTPLSTIRWYSEMLLGEMDGKLSDRQEKYLKEIYTANKHMIELVGALLNVSRIDLGKFAIEPESTNLLSVMDSVLKEINPQIEEKKLEVDAKYDSDIPKVDVDPDLIRIVFQNLLSNSVKYTPEGGWIRVRIERKDPSIEFSVADNGYGIPPHEQDKIFSKLFRAENIQEKNASGTGLGLYIVKAIMEKSGGSISFNSPTIPGEHGEKGRGTTFYGTIPLKGSPQKGGTKQLDAEPI